jgi:glyoxylase-like metal-dependent hydrolase (beta-lactamase superfamily II)
VTDLRRPGDHTSAPRPKKQEQEPASTEVVEVAPNVLRMQLPIWMPGLGHVNMYGLVDDRGIAVVDPGLPGPGSWKALQRRLRDAGFRVRDVHTVIVTHSHPDHFGGAGRLAKEADAELITHAAFTTWLTHAKDRTPVSEREAIELERHAAAAAQLLDLGPLGGDDERLADPLRADEDDLDRNFGSVAWADKTPWGGSKHPRPAFHRRMILRATRLFFSPPRPTRRVRHGDSLQLGGREWLAIHTPGHTLDHLCVYDPDSGVLLSGDHVLPTITPHISGVGNGADSLKSYISTLDLVARLDGISLGLPAHGHPFDDVPGRVEAIKRHHEERMQQIRSVSQALGPATVVAVSHEIFPAKHWGVMAESETFAHLEHLVLAGRAERWEEHGRLLYRVA